MRSASSTPTKRQQTPASQARRPCWLASPHVSINGQASTYTLRCASCVALSALLESGSIYAKPAPPCRVGTSFHLHGQQLCDMMISRDLQQADEQQRLQRQIEKAAKDAEKQAAREQKVRSSALCVGRLFLALPCCVG